MATKIPEDVIDQIRSSVNIADVVGQSVQLKKAGKNLFGLCPFHEERTPSFSVNEEKQIFHCFSCGRGGNVFKFLMDLEQLSFPAAVAEVAEFAGTPLDKQYLNSTVANPNQDQETTDLLALYAQSAKMYQHILVNTELGQTALDYLHQRGMTDETIATFGIGYAPANQLLLTFFQEHQADYQLLRQSGLFIENQAGELRDRFVDRVLFPIRDAQGRVVAFSGRVLTKAPDQPKYLNSPETKLFNKRKVLFNFDLARPAIRQQKSVILFEGFMDVIAAYSAGVQNGVASMGTSLTEEQIYDLQRVTDQLYICYDGDTPGQKATHRALKLMRDNQRLKLGVIQMPAGLDPDEYHRKYGDEKFVKVFQDAKETPTAFEMRYLRQGLNLQNTQTQLDYLDAVLKVIAQVPQSVERDLYLNQLTTEFHLDKDDLRSQVQSLINQSHMHQQQAPVPTPPPIADVQPTTMQQDARPLSRVERAERLLLYRILHEHDVWLQLSSDPDFSFVHQQYQDLYVLAQVYFNQYQEFDLARFTDMIDDDQLQQLVVALDYLTASDRSNPDELRDLKRVIMDEHPLALRIQQKEAAMQQASALGDQQLQRQLMVELVKLYQQAQALKQTED